MKKVIIFLTLVCILFPSGVHAKGNSNKNKNENKLEETISKNFDKLKEQKDNLLEKAEAWLEKKASLDQRKLLIARMKEEMSMFKFDISDLKNKTKQELYRQREKINEIRKEITVNFKDFKEMGELEKIEFKDFYEDMKKELKDIHKYRLALRSVNIKDFFKIDEINKSNVKKEDVNTILNDLE